jgi:hypothetical protein
MSWAKLLADNRLTALPPSKAELDNLRSIVARSLKDWNRPIYRPMRALFWLTTLPEHYLCSSSGRQGIVRVRWAHTTTRFWRWKRPSRHLRRCLPISMAAE